jgi:hypothetical protein
MSSFQVDGSSSILDAYILYHMYYFLLLFLFYPEGVGSSKKQKKEPKQLFLVFCVFCKI